MFRRTSAGGFLLVTAMWVAGCGDSHGGRMEVRGTVKLQGSVLKDGAIIFQPLDNQGTQSGCGITDGQYEIPANSGLKPGKYLVRITSGDGKNPSDEEAASPGGSTNIVSFDRIPEEWNNKTKQQVEVKSGVVNKFDFEIPKANTPRKKR